MLMGLTEFNGKPLKNVDDAGLNLPENDKAETPADQTDIPNDDFQKLVSRIKETLGERVEDVRESKTLTDSPIRLVNPPNAMNANMQRVQRLLDKEFKIPKKILELNRHNSLVGNLSNRLARNESDKLLNPLIEQLYENALVTEGIHPNPAEMIPRLQAIMEAAAQLN